MRASIARSPPASRSAAAFAFICGGDQLRSGIITLTTDFGDKDPFVGVVKGVIYSRFRDAQIIDLTHQISPQSIGEAAFWIERSFRWFPKGSTHVAVVDPGVGTARGILAVE